MRILVTGGAGFIGSHLVERLLIEGHHVVAVDNFLTGVPENLDHLREREGFAFLPQDMSQPLRDELVDDDFDRIYNLASPASPKGYYRYPIETLLVNSQGTYHALELARRHGARFVQASTSEVYGDPLVHPQPETYWGNVHSTGPRACYDEGKRFAEALIMEYVRQHKVDARIARIFNTYGPRSAPSDGRVVPNFCIQALEGRRITIYGDGTQTRSFCYVDDLVRGLVLLMETPDITGEIVNLGNPEEHTILEFAQRIDALTEVSNGIVFEPLPEDDPQRRRPDITKARQLLGWEPQVDLDDGLRKTLGFFREIIERPERFDRPSDDQNRPPTVGVDPRSHDRVDPIGPQGNCWCPRVDT
jgi:UDP-glucuronate decarboxylase